MDKNGKTKAYIQVGNGLRTFAEPTSVLLQSLRRRTCQCFDLSPFGFKLDKRAQAAGEKNRPGSPTCQLLPVMVKAGKI